MQVSPSPLWVLIKATSSGSGFLPYVKMAKMVCLDFSDILKPILEKIRSAQYA